MSARTGNTSVVPVAFEHAPVLLAPIVERAVRLNPQLIVDCTLGGAGHAIALLEACPTAQLLGIDRDEQALSVARERLARFGSRVSVVHGNFSEFAQLLAQRGQQKADLVLADFGVSSYQLDTPERGFSFRDDGPLDMRMDQSSGEPVHAVIDTLDERELADILRRYGEERHAKRVARRILAVRPTTTGALAQLVRDVLPMRDSKIDPATRTFQALRILVNDELQQIEHWCDALAEALRPGGLAMAIAFHSLEDRIVKQNLRHFAQTCICSPLAPICTCEHRATFALETKKPIIATQEEIDSNPRSRSAKLRIARRLESAA